VQDMKLILLMQHGIVSGLLTVKMHMQTYM